MRQTVAVLGRQPALGLAELESFFGAETVRPLHGNAALVDIEPGDFPINRFGGTMKACKLLVTLPLSGWDEISAHLIENVPKHLEHIPEGKIKFAISVYGMPVSVRAVNKTGLQIKKAIKATGRSVRVVQSDTPALNTAQISYNQLTGPQGLDLVIIADGERTVLAQTFAVQDIDAYAARDQARPKRDARVGMLPPKLAQIIINLATGQPGLKEVTVLDPFCGTGVVLQEAMLMGYNAYGTDLEHRMIEYSQLNLDWLVEKFMPVGGKFRLSVGDATDHEWLPPFNVIAAETYLGRPFSSEPIPQVLQEVVQDVGTIHRKFLKNVARQTKPGFRMCLAVPAWKTKNGFKHLKMLDSLEELGYTRIRFEHVKTDQLIYYRPGQHVAREIVVLKRI